MGIFRRKKLKGASAFQIIFSGAEASAEAGLPRGSDVASLVYNAYNPGPGIIGAVASGQPKDHEMDAIDVVADAILEALGRRDRQSIDEVSVVGVALLTRWKTYLESVGRLPREN